MIITAKLNIDYKFLRTGDIIAIESGAIPVRGEYYFFRTKWGHFEIKCLRLIRWWRLPGCKLIGKLVGFTR